MPKIDPSLNCNEEIIFVLVSLSTVLLISTDAIVVLSMNSIAKEVIREIFASKQLNIVNNLCRHRSESTKDLQSISIKF